MGHRYTPGEIILDPTKIMSFRAKVTEGLVYVSRQCEDSRIVDISYKRGFEFDKCLSRAWQAWNNGKWPEANEANSVFFPAETVSDKVEPVVPVKVETTSKVVTQAAKPVTPKVVPVVTLK